jgi:hypothetical protein
MKKVGILTFHFSKNYGALFQAYGLRSYLVNQGYDVEFINYHPEHIEAGGELKLNNFYKKSGIKVLYLKLTSLKEKYFGNKNIRVGFQNFRDKFLNIQGKEYKSLDELNNANLNYDFIICGSDQIWSQSDHFGIDPIYFLDFVVKKNTKKISYAPSFGKDSIDEKYYQNIASYLESFKSISAREKSGVNIIKKLTNKDVSLVPDPSILVNNYMDIMKPYPNINKNYIFCYYLRSRLNVGDIAEYVSEKTDYQIYSPHNPHRRWKEVGETIYPSPNQWLYMLYNSKVVITNSFHGTILSILLNKPFIVVGIGGERAKYNERVLNLLSQCSLEHRLVTEYNVNELDALLEENINWVPVNEKVNKMRLQGVDFLSDALKGSENE